MVVAAEGQEAGQGVVVGLQLAPAGLVADGPEGIARSMPTSRADTPCTTGTAPTRPSSRAISM